MATLALRALVTCVVVVVGLVSLLQPGGPQTPPTASPSPSLTESGRAKDAMDVVAERTSGAVPSQPTLAEVMRNTASFGYQCAVEDAGHVRTVFRLGDNLRIENRDADNTYYLFAEGANYLVNETQNQRVAVAANVTADSSGAELFQILDPTCASVNSVPPVKPVAGNGRLHYSVVLPTTTGESRLFKAEAVDGKLVKLVCEPTPEVNETVAADQPAHSGLAATPQVPTPDFAKPAAAAPTEPRAADPQPGAAKPAASESVVKKWHDRPQYDYLAENLPRQNRAAESRSLRVVALGAPLDEKLFVVKDTLTEDGRIGKIVGVQGLVSIRPVNQERWSPVTGKLVLKPGDWLRTDTRGANAVHVKLIKSTDLILGPGTQVELLKTSEIRIHGGEIEVTAEEAAPIELIDPKDSRTKVTGTQFYRRQNEQLAHVTNPDLIPKWLAGFKGATVHESIGSLLAKSTANPDARNEPLTVGYHKVTVDVRDQIARTTIEESFVNHTNARMEGVFHFPLPADASISGFGMWIGNELIEADVVEKQRAREIYETILREKRDPGLLEWEGGNVFKARVFPIEAQSEKRIKLVYTQVLPLRGGKYRYSYALQSEFLKQHPLRELQINLQLNSAVPLKNVTCPTHTARTQLTKNSAQVEFSAQDYVPTRDFEVVVDTEQAKSELVLIPHQRGEDGYFLLQIMPGAEGAWERDVLPDAAPLNVLVVADTSASMLPPVRETQAEFIASLLSSLTPKDTFNLATCDVKTDWTFPKPVAATADNVTAARKQLEQRVSLGWTDLDQALTSAFAQATPTTHVVYVGDGISTIGDANPNAAADRLKGLYPGQGTVHAVIVGSSYEAAVMNTLGSLGGGSVRRINGEQGPQPSALELMTELTRPGLRDLAVEFRGLRTAAVYPGRLPNLPPGSQQILLGRYLPAATSATEGVKGTSQTGEVVVTARRNGEPVRLTTHVSLAEAEKGNDFIPRLWARMHVDHLLEQGSSPKIRDEIIALSEEFHVMTPYTSLLVLETDADRERFKVQRRFEMRDGQQFFQEGKDNARYELVRSQMLKAQNWRVGLRSQILRQLATLGRSQRQADVLRQRINRWASPSDSGPWGRAAGLGVRGGIGSGGRLNYDFDGDNFFDEFGLEESDSKGYSVRFESRTSGGVPGEDFFQSYDFRRKADGPFDDRLSLAGESHDGLPGLLAGEPMPFGRELKEAEDSFPSMSVASPEPALGEALELLDESKANRGWFEEEFRWEATRSKRSLISGPLSANSLYSNSALYAGRGVHYWQGPRWWESLIPALARAPRPATAQPLPETWSEEAIALSKSLLRTEQLRNLTGGLELVRQTDNFNIRSELTTRSKVRELVGANAWLIHHLDDGAASTIQWCDASERGVLNTAFQFGRTRKPSLKEPAPENKSAPLGLNDWSITAAHDSWRSYSATVEKPQEGQAVIVLKARGDLNFEGRLIIDVTRNVVLKYETRSHGVLQSQTIFSDFVEVAGRWWAQRIEIQNGKGQVQQVSTQTVTALDEPKRLAAWNEELAVRDRVQFVPVDSPTVTEARRSIAAGKGTFADHLTLIIRHTLSQQWTLVNQHLDQAGKLAADKPGMAWIRLAVLRDSRRHEEWKSLAQMLASRIITAPAGSVLLNDRYALAAHLLSEAGSVLQANEVLTLLDELRPIYEQQPPHLRAVRGWQEARIQYLDQTGRVEEASTLAKQMAEQNRTEVHSQTNYAQRLVNSGDVAAARAWIEQALKSGIAWESYERTQFHTMVLGFMEAQGRFAEMAAYAKEWAEQNPDEGSPYQYWLSGLVRSNTLDEAEALMREWLAAGRTIQGDMPPAVRRRFEAAMNLALGQGHNLYRQRLDEAWIKELTECVLATMLDEKRLFVADRIMGDWRYRQSDPQKVVRQKALAVLKEQAGTLSPLVLTRLVGWALEEPLTPVAEFKAIQAVVMGRWSDTKDADVRHALGQIILQFLNSKGTLDERLAFLRKQTTDGPEKHRTSYFEALFNTLVEQPWSEAFEVEAFSLLTKLSDARDESTRTAHQIANLYRLVDGILPRRLQAARQGIEHPENNTGAEKAKLEKEIAKAQREGLIARLKAEAPKHPGVLGQWIDVERMTLEIQLLALDPERNVTDVIARCWELLPEKPPVAVDPSETEEKSEDEVRKEEQQRMLQGRVLAMLTYLATRSRADAELVTRFEKYLDAGIAAEGPEQEFWKGRKYQWLIVKDKPAELQAALRQWMQADDPSGRWRISLAYLLVETNAVAEAISQMEAAAQENLLGPQEYASLAEWYVAVDRRTDSETAQIKRFGTTQDWQLQHSLNQWLGRAVNTTPPTALDDLRILMIRAGLEKSESPASFGSIAGEYYRHYRDFRLLSGAADAVIGHSAMQIYPYLETFRSSILTHVNEEAAIDQMVAHLAKVREKAKTAVDRRALDLLEMLVERRAAELPNQPGPHATRALVALQNSWKHEFQPGELKPLAEFLAHLGKIPVRPLATEQLRQLDELHQRTTEGTIDRVFVAASYAAALSEYGRGAEGVSILRTALNRYEETTGGALPYSARSAVEQLIGLYEGQRHFADAERFLEHVLSRGVTRQFQLWLKRRQLQSYHSALQNDGSVSLGSGQTLFEALVRRILKELDDSDQNHRVELVNQLCAVFTTAHSKKLEKAPELLREFALDRLPVLLASQSNNSQSVVGTVATALENVAPDERTGRIDALTFLITQIEREPAWFKWQNQDGWNQFGWRIAQLVHTLNYETGPVTDRLLKIVLQELRSDLESQEQRQRSLYHQGYGYFWEAQVAAFVRVAEEVSAKNKASGKAVTYVSHYLFHGCRHFSRAIEMLSEAERNGILDSTGQWQLVNFLHEQQRWGESIAVLQKLIVKQPWEVSYRVSLMRAYFKTQQPNALREALAAADKDFHEENRWSVEVAAQLGASTLENRLYRESVAYYREAIEKHEARAPGRGVGDNVTWSCYSALATAYAGLNDTPNAVDASVSAFHTWPRRQRDRSQAVESLKRVFRRAKDLPAYVAQIDAEAARTNTDRPVVRKYLGIVLAEEAGREREHPNQRPSARKKHELAAAQLELAIRLDPNDKETHARLVEVYLALERPADAIRATLAEIALLPRDVTLYKSLGDLYAQGEQPQQAERAYTSMVEMLPNETEGHLELARIRERQNNWPAAISHWQRVAALRTLEPTGLLGLAAAQIHERQIEAARESLRTLRQTTWPDRFRSDLEEQLPKLDRELSTSASSPRKR